jgi:hypothetical protein
VTEAPGLDREANFWNGGFFLRFDSRDNPGDARAGSFLFSQFEIVEGSRQRLGDSTNMISRRSITSISGIGGA